MFYLLDYEVSKYVIAADDKDRTIELLNWEIFENTLMLGITIEGVSKVKDTYRLSRVELPITSGEAIVVSASNSGLPVFSIDRVAASPKGGIALLGHILKFSNVDYTNYLNMTTPSGLYTLQGNLLSTRDVLSCDSGVRLVANGKSGQLPMVYSRGVGLTGCNDTAIKVSVMSATGRRFFSLRPYRKTRLATPFTVDASLSYFDVLRDMWMTGVY